MTIIRHSTNRSLLMMPRRMCMILTLPKRPSYSVYGFTVPRFVASIRLQSFMLMPRGFPISMSDTENQANSLG